MNPTTTRYAPSPTPAALSMPRRIWLPLPEEPCSFTDAEIRLGIAQLWSAYLETLSKYGDASARARDLEALGKLVGVLLMRARDEVNGEPI
jgi:hypothetical protein